jgi:hypothetical protein
MTELDNSEKVSAIFPSCFWVGQGDNDVDRNN